MTTRRLPEGGVWVHAHPPDPNWRKVYRERRSRQAWEDRLRIWLFGAVTYASAGCPLWRWQEFGGWGPIGFTPKKADVVWHTKCLRRNQSRMGAR